MFEYKQERIQVYKLNNKALKAKGLMEDEYRD